MPDIFAYGTLKQGGKWHHLIEDQIFLGEDKIEGAMYLEAGGYYPILFLGTDVIEGEVWSLSDEAYQKVWELEADANYDVRTVSTAGGRQVIVFFMKDLSQKDPTRKIDSFNAEAFFQRWLNETPKNSQSYQFFLNWGGVQIKISN